jgi:hypothetical protein
MGEVQVLPTEGAGTMKRYKQNKASVRHNYEPSRGNEELR